MLAQQSVRTFNDAIQLDSTKSVLQLPTVSVEKGAKKEIVNFVPNSGKAVWLSALMPGLGQIYNQKYWKLPLIYGGFTGLIYGMTWNGQNLKDYTTAYSDLKDTNPNTNSFLDILPTSMQKSYADGTLTTDQLTSIVKNRKDYFRRNRDLTIISMIGLYFVTMIDAYVDAQLFQFDISPDLSLRVEPTVVKVNLLDNRTQAIGLQCSINF